MQLFYSNDIKDNIINLDSGESLHCIKVLRKRRGDVIYVLDGRGSIYEAAVKEEHPKHCVLEILSVEKEPPHNVRIHIAISPTKTGDRWEWFLEKVTEIGVDEITPVICERTERSKVNIDRAEKILVSAIKQSKSLYLPVINEPVSFPKFVRKTGINSVKFIAHCGEASTKELKDTYIGGSNMLILIGPEGDFSESEIALAKEYGYKEVSLGTNRLRTETAGIVACHTFKLLN